MAIVKWDNRWYVRAFRLATDGMDDSKIAKVLGVPIARFERWIREDTALREGLEEARSPKSCYADFKAFIYEKLPRKVRELWDELDGADKLPKVDRTRTERIKAAMEVIEAAPERHQQALLLHAMIKCNFILTNACLKTGINPQAVYRWCQDDENFRRLLSGIDQYKGDFFESAFIDLCKRGDSAAIIHANKTFNKKRGYGLEMTLNTNAEQVVKHEVSIEELPADAKRAVLEAIRRQKAEALPQLEDNRDVVDAEVVG